MSRQSRSNRRVAPAAAATPVAVASRKRRLDNASAAAAAASSDSHHHHHQQEEQKVQERSSTLQPFDSSFHLHSAWSSVEPLSLVFELESDDADWIDGGEDEKKHQKHRF